MIHLIKKIDLIHQWMFVLGSFKTLAFDHDIGTCLTLSLNLVKPYMLLKPQIIIKLMYTVKNI